MTTHVPFRTDGIRLRSLLFSTACLALASTTAAPAEAARLETVDATAFYRQDLTVLAGARIRIELTHLSPGASPIMYLLRVPSRGAPQQVARATAGHGPTMLIDYRNSSSSTRHMLIVHAADGRAQGTATLTIDGQTFTPPIPVGGAPVLASELSRGPQDILHTVELPGGSVWPVVLVLRSSATVLYDIQWEGGAGDGVAFSPSLQDDVYVVGTPHIRDGRGRLSEPRGGPARIVVVDEAVDSDGDGLGDQVESELGTCAAVAGCSAPNPSDSDRDGLTDRDEVLGVADLRLPRWGASPLHKDVFVEVDHLAELGTNPFSAMRASGTLEDWVAEVTGAYLAGPAAHLENPDGVDGLALHLDLGVDPLDPADEAVFGDFSSSARGVPKRLFVEITGLFAAEASIRINGTTYVTTVVQVDADDAARDLADYINGLPEPVEASVSGDASFALLTIDSEVAGQSFTASFDVPTGAWATVATRRDGDEELRRRRFDDRYVDSIRIGRMRYAVITGLGGGGQASGAAFVGGVGPHTFAHELGHTLGLSHSGHDQWGTAGLNCLPHYDSLMNYAFEGPLRFQSEIGGLVINPKSVDEWSPFGVSTYDPSHLAAAPWFLTTLGYGVDFDRRGAPSSGSVRPMVTLARGQSCGAMTVGRQRIAPSTRVRGTMDVLRAGSRIYTLYARDDGEAFYHRAALGTREEHGCTGDDDPRNATPCHAWTPSMSLGLQSGARGLSAVFHEGLMFVAYRDELDALRVAIHLVDSSGDLVWLYESVVQGARSTRSPRLAQVEMPSGSSWGAGLHLVLLWNDAGNVRWHRWDPSSGWLDLGYATDAGGTPIDSTTAVAAVTWPDPTATTSRLRVTCVAVKSFSGAELSCLNPHTGAWAVVPDAFTVPRNGGPCGDGMASRINNCSPWLAGDPELAFRIARDGLGRPLAPDGSDGHLVLSYRTLGDSAFFILSSRISSSAPLGSSHVGLTDWRDHVQNTWADMGDDNAPTFYDDVSLGGMIGAEALRLDTEFVDFLPFAGGSFDADLRVFSDFMVMEDHVCRKLVGDGDPSCDGACRDAVCGPVDVLEGLLPP